MMTPRKRKPPSRLSVVISLVIHGLIIAALGFFAAREGYLGKEVKKLAVSLAPKEKPKPPEEKPKEKPPEPKPVEPAKTPEPAPVVEAPKLATSAPPPASLKPAGVEVPLTAAPAAAEIPAFQFEGGHAVESTSDPVTLYKGYLEYSLRSNWDRPEDVNDDNFAVEVEVTVDPTGRIQHTTWEHGSGNEKWDNSVKQALAKTTSVGRAPPKGFPPQIRIRFDVQVESAPILQ
jgi:TonB family protein